VPIKDKQPENLRRFGMIDKRKFGRRKSDVILRSVLITSLLAHLVIAAALIMGCSPG
jgi:hypothetical protein